MEAEWRQRRDSAMTQTNLHIFRVWQVRIISNEIEHADEPTIDCPSCIHAGHDPRDSNMKACKRAYHLRLKPTKCSRIWLRIGDHSCPI